MPPKSRPIFAAGFAFFVCAALAACGDEKPTAPPAAAAKPNVSVVVLNPQDVAITAELPGRTSASLEAEVRPQVGGIIRKRNFKEGSEVKEGDVLYELDPATYQASYDSAVASLQKAEGALPSAQAKVDRYGRLTSNNAVSEQDLEDAKSTLAQAKADVASAKASVETARINLEYTKIRAPISGRVDASAITVGALVTAEQTTALTTIRSLDPINVDVTQASSKILNLREAVDAGQLRFTGINVSVNLKLDNGKEYAKTGTVEFAEATVDQSAGTVKLRAQFPNPDRIVLPGMYVRAVIQEGVAPNSYLVPQRGVSRNTRGEPTARFVTRDNKVEERVLTVDRSIGNNWLVTAGVEDGDRVIVEGTQRTQIGQDVDVKEVTIDNATGELKAASIDTPNKVASLTEAQH
ncbi:Acriflavine resistance protein A [Agrobacterium deltaense Zutra 3/1]|uniref:Acriflavine resistance protein A n=1 Tax=Agrobacterium deltaense Zutra 3/1 TaxID=1183427 RepID=A0A1S7S275_9HYPH|nr:efflux RND transporter periplasmic adaptor subunit [Agrobacterium deltaense]CUX61236.1 Acriflavine resistance protein A [Agrobacterium deltaense Zutra 3/1]